MEGREVALPGSQLGGVQNSIFAFPLNKRLGVPLCLTPQQCCVALVHSCTLWLHLEGDENCTERDQGGSGSSERRSCRNVNVLPPALLMPAPGYYLPPSAGHGHGSGPVARWMQCKCSCQRHLGSPGQSVGSQHCLSPIQGGCCHLQKEKSHHELE